MNRNEANTVRQSIGLPPLPPVQADSAKRKRQDANRATRAQASRDLKTKRNKGGK